MRLTRIFFILLLVGLLSYALTAHFEPVDFRSDILANIGNLLGALLLATLLMERALDVFLTTWRADGSEKLSSEIKHIQAKIDSLKKSGKTDCEQDVKREMVNLKTLTEELQAYRSKTRTIALWSGLFIGVTISTVGFRILSSIISPDSLKMLNNLNNHQEMFFDLFDILLTGGLIAGGSDGIHKIMDLFRNFMEASTAKVKNQSQTSAQSSTNS